MSNKKVQALKYAFKHGVRYSIDAETAGKELARIQKEHGVTTPGAVVDASRPEDAPLHPVFEWRDEVAAEGYRKWQARMLIKSVTVIEQRDGKEVASPVYVHVPASEPTEQGEGASAAQPLQRGYQPLQRGYQPVSVVVQRPDMYALALADLARRLTAARESLDALKRAADTSPETDSERMARIAIAVQAMQTASAAVSALP